MTNFLSPKLSASTAAADLASQLGNGESTATNGWGNISRHRHQQSLTNLSSAQMTSSDTMVPNQAGASEAKAFNRQFRHSIDLNQQYKEPSSDSNAPSVMAPPSTQVPATPPKLQTSFSANDIPTVKNIGVTGAPTPASANAHAQQHFHNHNASIGRIPLGAAKRHSRELSGDNHVNVTQAGAFPSIQSQLQANAPAFGPVPASQAISQAPAVASPVANSPGQYGGYPHPPVYGAHNYNHNPTSPNANGYNTNMGLVTMGLQNMNLNNGYPNQNYAGYNAVYQNAAIPRDSQQRVIQQRRAQDSEG